MSNEEPAWTLKVIASVKADLNVVVESDLGKLCNLYTVFTEGSRNSIGELIRVIQKKMSNPGASGQS